MYVPGAVGMVAVCMERGHRTRAASPSGPLALASPGSRAPCLHHLALLHLHLLVCWASPRMWGCPWVTALCTGRLAAHSPSQSISVVGLEVRVHVGCMVKCVSWNSSDTEERV